MNGFISLCKCMHNDKYKKYIPDKIIFVKPCEKNAAYRPPSAKLTLSLFPFNRGNNVHDICFVILGILSEDRYLDKHDLVKHVY